jgi:hypothetical protein
MMAASWWALFLMSLVLVSWAVGGCRRLSALRACVISAWTIVDSAIQQRYTLASTMLDALREPPHVDPRLLEAGLAAGVRLAAVRVRLGAARAARPPHAMAAFDAATQSFERTVFRLFAALDQASRAAAADGCEGRRVDADASSCAAALPQAVAAAMRGWQRSEPALSAARSAFNAAVDRYNRAAAEAPTWVLSRLFGFAPAARW